VVDGFRIGRRIISAVERPVGPPLKIDCRWFVLAKAFYTVRVEATWYRPMEFTTNLSIYAQDTNGRHYAMVPLTVRNADETWRLDRSVGDVHAVPLCLTLTSSKER
ncbi:MAG: hypothetical protein ABW048_07490, partial [Sphingobium sp.]